MDKFDSGEMVFNKDLAPKTVLAPYVDNPEKYDGHYGFDAGSDKKWYVTYKFLDNDSGADDIKKRLAGRAASAGLYQSMTRSAENVYKDGDTVYMVAR